MLCGVYDNNAIKELLIDMRRGTAFGLGNLKKHKSLYDGSLREKSYNDIRYVLFISKQKPFIVFSGLIWPDFDFIGRQLQNIGNHESNLDLITFCSVPMDYGWGFLFSWHNSSSNICVEFMRSLATKIYDDNNKLGDTLFRIVMYNCENFAISPHWWEQLPMDHKEQITSMVSLRANIFYMTKPDYLMKGLEGISNWGFERVISKME